MNDLRKIKDKLNVTAILIAVNMIVFVCMEFTGSSEDTRILIRWGGAYVPYIEEGQYWRLLTAMFLHSGMRHLVNNMLVLGVVGTLLERKVGKIRYLLIYFGGGLIGGYVNYYLDLQAGKNVVSIGASGAVFAVAGAMLWVVIAHRGRVENISLENMLVMLGLMVYFSFTTENVANAAHIGGLVSGFLICMILYRTGTSRRQREWQKKVNGQTKQ